MGTSRFLKAVRSILPIVLLTGLAACNLPASRPLSPVPFGPEGPQTWIDAPLDGMHIALAPYEVVFHGSDAGAITQMELKINDQPAALPGSPEAGQNLATMKYTWVPPLPGEYVLRARSQGAGGSWSEEAQVTVYVGDVTPSPTPTLVVTVSPTASATPTGVVTVSPTPSPTPVAAAALTFDSQRSGDAFYYGGCSPASIDFQVTVSGGSLDNVELFLKLNDQSGNGTSGWMSYGSMRAMGGGVYRLTVKAGSIPGYEKFPAAWVSYQFIATLRGAVVGRSPSMTGVTLGACGSAPARPVPPNLVPGVIPPILIVTNTPEFVK